MRTPSEIYWDARWRLWDFRDQLLVRLLSQKMSRTPTLYVHSDSRSRPVAVVRLLDGCGNEVPEVPYDHDHVEGRLTCGHCGETVCSSSTCGATSAALARLIAKWPPITEEWRAIARAAAADAGRVKGKGG